MGMGRILVLGLLVAGCGPTPVVDIPDMARPVAGDMANGQQASDMIASAPCAWSFTAPGVIAGAVGHLVEVNTQAEIAECGFDANAFGGAIDIYQPRNDGTADRFLVSTVGLTPAQTVNIGSDQHTLLYQRTTQTVCNGWIGTIAMDATGSVITVNAMCSPNTDMGAAFGSTTIPLASQLMISGSITFHH